MIHRFIGRCVAVLSLAFAAAGAAQASYATVYAFGDSLSDTGNVLAATGNKLPQPDDYFKGRFSNGPAAVEYLASGLSANLVNFAYGGAMTGANNGAFANTPLELTGILSQVGMFQSKLGGGSADSSALYFLWGGANDFQYLGYDGTVAKGAISNLVDAIMVLYGLGARDFMVPGLADLGATPAGLASGASGKLTQLSTLFNAGLVATLDTLEAALPGSDFTFVDIFGAQHALIDDAAAHGLSNVTDACFTGYVGVAGTQCSTPAEYLYWDRIHPSAAAHQFLGSTMLQLAVPEPGSAAVTGLALAVLLWVRRPGRRVAASTRRQPALAS